MNYKNMTTSQVKSDVYTKISQLEDEISVLKAKIAELTTNPMGNNEVVLILQYSQRLAEKYAAYNVSHDFSWQFRTSDIPKLRKSMAKEAQDLQNLGATKYEVQFNQMQAQATLEILKNI